MRNISYLFDTIFHRVALTNGGCLVGMLDHQEKVTNEKDALLRKLRDRISTLESQRVAEPSRARLEAARHQHLGQYIPRGYPPGLQREKSKNLRDQTSNTTQPGTRFMSRYVR